MKKLCAHGALVMMIAVLSVLLMKAAGYATTPTTFRRRCSHLYAKKKKKLSMAEKRAQRSKRRSRRPDTSHLPPPKHAEETTVDDSKAPEQNHRATETTTKAQQLLETQRESVATLTSVKRALDQLPVEEIRHDLTTKGYWYGDDFLRAPHILSQLQTEGLEMLPKMTADRLGTGEYVAALEGGEEQYADCPRSIEFVVSTTKHLPSLLEDYTSLSDSQVSATLRTFDRAAWQASRQLLMPNSSEDDDDDRRLAAAESSLVVDDPSLDLRRLSICYYVVSLEWQGGGGGLRFADGTTVEARRDRLVLWKSAETPVQKLPWRASDEQPVGSCLELHLVEEPSRRL